MPRVCNEHHKHCRHIVRCRVCQRTREEKERARECWSCTCFRASQFTCLVADTSSRGGGGGGGVGEKNGSAAVAGITQTSTAAVSQLDRQPGSHCTAAEATTLAYRQIQLSRYGGGGGGASLSQQDKQQAVGTGRQPTTTTTTSPSSMTTTTTTV